MSRNDILIFMDRKRIGGVILAVLAFCLMIFPAKSQIHVQRSDWAPDVKAAINDFMNRYHHRRNAYVVFDFDNTTSIFDISLQLMPYQLETMAFELTPEHLESDLNRAVDPSVAILKNMKEDICRDYAMLYKKYGPFSHAGVDEATAGRLGKDAHWLDFATKMLGLYDVMEENQSVPDAYAWIQAWYDGMTEQQVYDMAFRCHKMHQNIPTSEVTWKGPRLKTKAGPMDNTWTSGIQVTENMKELWKALHDNGIDVWVCSASDINVVRAAVDAFGLHDYCKGVVAMTARLTSDGRYRLGYDYENGCCCLALPDGSWTKGTTPSNALTAGPGKVTAINNVLLPMYGGQGPMAGFMDSSGDFNFCTEYKSLKLVICFNRATRKVTEGGGLIAELAIYQRDVLGYNLQKANIAGDTYYVLQGRDENGLRTFRPSNATLRLGQSGEKLFDGEDNYRQLDYMKQHRMSTEQIINTFCRFKAKGDPDNPLPFAYGFLRSYAGYHSR